MIRLPFIVAIVVGLGLAAVVVGTSQLPAMRAADQLVTVTSPIVNPAGVQRMRDDLEDAQAVATAMQDRGLPRLASLSERTPAELLAALDAGGSAFPQALSRLPAINELAERVVSNLERREGQFRSAAELPGLGLTLRDAVWAQLLLAVLLVAAGLAGLMRPRRALAPAVLAAGLMLVITPVVLGQPARTADTDELLDSLRPFSVERVRARETALATVRSVFTDLREDVIPFVATHAATTPDAVAAQLERASDRLSPAALERTAVILERYGSLVEFSARIQPLLVRADRLSAHTSMWILIGSGIALASAGAAGLVGARPRRGATGSAP